MFCYNLYMFKLVSQFTPSGDQPKAISQLVDGINKGMRGQTLLGVTGSGKTFTMANVIQKVNRPTLVLAHNRMPLNTSSHIMITISLRHTSLLRIHISRRILLLTMR